MPQQLFRAAGTSREIDHDSAHQNWCGASLLVYLLRKNNHHYDHGRIPCILADFREWGAAATDQKKLISSRVPPGRGSGASWDVAANVNLVI